MRLDIRLYVDEVPCGLDEKVSADEERRRLVAGLKKSLQYVLGTFDRLEAQSGLYAGPHQHEYHHMNYFPRPDNVRIVEEWSPRCGKSPYRIYCGNLEDDPDHSGCGFHYVDKAAYAVDHPYCPQCGTAVDYKDHDWLEGYTQHQQKMEDLEDGI